MQLWGRLIVVLGVLAAACSNSVDTTTTTAVAAPTTVQSTTTSTTATTTSTTTSTTTTTVASEAVGSVDRLNELIVSVTSEVGLENLGGLEDAPELDMSNPDPIAAFESIIAFDTWLAVTWPDPRLAEIYTFEGSAARRSITDGFNTFFTDESVVVFLDQPYVISDPSVAYAEDVLPATVLATVPSNAVTIRFSSSSGPFEVRRVSDGHVNATSSGWPSKDRVNVLVPSVFGWQIWYAGGRLMSLRSPILFFIVLALAIGLIDTAPADAQFVDVGDGHLDAWTMTGELLVGASEATAGYRASLDCAFHEDLVIEYNEARLWDTEEGWYYISRPDISNNELDLLEAFGSIPGNWTPLDWDRYRRSTANFCLDVHIDGWLSTTDSLIELVEDGHELIQVNVDGDDINCEYGDVSVVQSTYYFWGGSWVWLRGINWVENPSGGILVSGDLNFRCLEIFENFTDVAQITEAVPTTQTNVNPLFDGLTGLDTWLWYDFSQLTSRELGPYTVAISSRGQTWTLTTFAWVDKVMWDVDCVSACTFRGMLTEIDQTKFDYVLDLNDTEVRPATIYDGGAGTDDGAVAKHLYETKGDYVISTATVWRGYYEHNGFRVNYDPVVVADQRDYTVIEIRSTPRGEG